MGTITTERLVLRPPVESDRARFVELFTDPTFMVFANLLDVEAANARFDRMVALVALVPYAKQPIVERSSGTVVGYTGVGTVSFEGIDRLEWGWRLEAGFRGRGYATEAASALLTIADETVDGEMLCLIDPDNRGSRRVADKLGFTWTRCIDWDGDATEPVDVLVRPVGAGGPPLRAPTDERR